jgi:phosphoenolpyruvate carboxykinase (GTP)
MGDYFAHWLKMGKVEGADLPRVFYVNWFRKDADGKFLWPGFGENSRVLEWVFRRCEGKAEAVETPIGLLPPVDAIDTSGLEISDEAMNALLSVDTDLVKQQLPQLREHLEKFGDKLPAEIPAQLDALEQRLG